MNNLLIFERTMKLGGAEKVVCQMCKYLKDDFDKIIVCSSGGVNVEKISNLGIKHIRINDICSKNPIHIIQNIFKLYQIIKKEQITIVHSQHRMAAFYTEILSFFVHVKKVYTAHNTFYDKKILTRWALKNTQIIAVGDAVRKNFEDYFRITSNKITVLHNCIECREGEVIEDKQMKAAEKAGAIIVTNIGRLSEQKGFSYYIDAAEVVIQKGYDAKFFIVGDGELFDILKKQIVRKNLQNDIIFLGYREDIFSIIAQSDIVVLSSLWEGFPLTPLEVFSEGKPIIATNVDGTPEIVKDEYNGLLIEPKDSEAIAKAVIRLIEDEKLKINICANAKVDYMNKYSMKYFIDEYRNFYRKGC